MHLHLGRGLFKNPKSSELQGPPRVLQRLFHLLASSSTTIEPSTLKRMGEELETRFDRAAEEVSSGSIGNLSQNEQLQLYGLYSMVRKGDPPNSSPSAIMDPRGYAKWASWKEQSHLSRDDAMRNYVQLVESLSSVPRKEASTKTDEGLGSKASNGFDFSFAGEASAQEARDLSYWASTGNTEAVLNCLDKMGLSPNYRDEENLTPLMRAADRNEKGVVDILVEAGAELDAVDDDGLSALHYAVLCEHVEMAAILVSYGASVDLEDAEGVTPASAASNAIRDVFASVKAGTWTRESTKFTKTTRWIASFPSSPVLSYWAIGAATVVLVAGLIAMRYRTS